MKLKITPLILSLFLIFSSCTKQLDFSQAEDFSFAPIVESSLVFFTLNQLAFFDEINSVEAVAPIEDVTGFSVLQSNFLQNNLTTVDLSFEVNNEFDRDFIVTVAFLDALDVEAYVLAPIAIPKNTQDVKYNERIPISGNTPFLRATKIRVSIQLSPSSDGTVLDPSIEQTFVFKSSGIFYLRS